MNVRVKQGDIVPLTPEIIQRLYNKIEQLRAELDTSWMAFQTSVADPLRAEIEKLDKLLTTQRGWIDKREEKIEELQGQLCERLAQIRERDEQLIDKEEQQREKSRRIHKLVRLIDDLQQKLTEKDEQLRKKNNQLKAQQSLSPSEICSRYHLQNCHVCNRMDCCDNTSPARERIGELEKLIKAERKCVDSLREDLDEKDRKIAGLQGRLCERLAQLREKEEERSRLHEYCDKLAAALPKGILPKDVENLKNANTALSAKVMELEAQLEEWESWGE